MLFGVLLEGLRVWEMGLGSGFAFAWVEEGNHGYWVSCLIEECEEGGEEQMKNMKKTFD